MKTIKRPFLIIGFLTLPLSSVIQGQDKSQVSIGGLNLGYTSDWIVKLAETTKNVDLLKINFNSFKETVPDNGIFAPDTTGLKLKKVTPPKVDENMEKRPVEAKRQSANIDKTR